MQRLSHPSPANQLVPWGRGWCVCVWTRHRRYGESTQGGCPFSCWLLAGCWPPCSSQEGVGTVRRAWEQSAEAGLGDGGPCGMHSLPFHHLGSVPSPRARGPLLCASAVHSVMPVPSHIYSLLPFSHNQEVLQGRPCTLFCYPRAQYTGWHELSGQ